MKHVAPFPGNLYYNSFSYFLRAQFKERVQKISINAGFSCPNRDGSKATGGCVYCNNKSFVPSYCHKPGEISEQLERGIGFFSKRYPSCRFLAYFQAYSNTYADISLLEQLYREAMAHKKISGLIISTRPDCVNADVTGLLQDIAAECFLLVEIGVESTLDMTLNAINRCHSYECSQTTIKMLNDAGIMTSAHLILGLPGESESDYMEHALRLSSLPLTAVKLHHLQIIRGTAFAHQYKENPDLFNLFTLVDYIKTVSRFLTCLRDDLFIERLCGSTTDDLLIAPRWGPPAHEVPPMINAYMKAMNLRQGCGLEQGPV